MKKHVILMAAAALAVCACGSDAKQPLPSFIHATYSTKELVSEEELLCPGYEDFDFIYHMAMPSWAGLDFDCTREQALAYADAVDYAAEGGQMALVPQMIAKAHEAGTRILLCLGGQQEFVQFIERPERLHRLADYLVRLIGNNDFDGADIDWEITLDKELHIGLMSDIRSQLDSLETVKGRDMYLTTALSIDHVYSEDQAQRLSELIDWVNIMSYDMCGGVWGDLPYHNTAMTSLWTKLENWKNFSHDKLCLGLANYGFYYKGIEPGVQVEGPLSKYGRYITYREFYPMSVEQGWVEEYDGEAQVSYYFSPDRGEFVTIENPETMLNKIKWICAQDFRGVFWWEFHHDYTRPRLATAADAAASPDLSEGQAIPGSHALIDVVTDYLGR